MTAVKLIGITESVLPGVNSAEDLVAYAARVSNPTNQMNSETAPKLLKYLMKNKHWSPFEMVSVVMEIKTTRDIARQILRHRSFSFQEFSQRYADPTKMDFEYKRARIQDYKNRQNSIETKDEYLLEQWYNKQAEVLAASEEAYIWALDNGIAKEQARAVLPEGMTPSVLYMSGTLRSWIHYIQLRTEVGTQKEHREIAYLCKEIITNNFPSLEL